MFSERYCHPTDLPQKLAVFPLRGAILLPRATLPINIFEPRYLAMLDDVISGDRLLGIVQPGRGSDPEHDIESPTGATVEIRNIGGVGRVTAFQELDDGRVLITLTGISRFAIKDEPVSGKPYRICTVDYGPFAGDFEQGLGEELVDRETFLSVLKTYLDVHNLETDWESIAKASTEFLVNSLSVVSPYGEEEKQALLEAEDLKTRADILVALAQMELAGGEGSSGSGSTLQ